MKPLSWLANMQPDIISESLSVQNLKCLLLIIVGHIVVASKYLNFSIEYIMTVGVQQLGCILFVEVLK